MAQRSLFGDPEETSLSVMMLRFLPGELTVDVTVLTASFAEGAGAAFAPHFLGQTLASNADEVHLFAHSNRREIDRGRNDVFALVVRQQELVHSLVDSTGAVSFKYQCSAKFPPAAERVFFSQKWMQSSVADRTVLVERNDGVPTLETPLQSQRLSGQEGRFFGNRVRQAFVDLIGKFLGLLRFDRNAVPDTI